MMPLSVAQPTRPSRAICFRFLGFDFRNTRLATSSDNSGTRTDSADIVAKLNRLTTRMLLESTYLQLAQRLFIVFADLLAAWVFGAEALFVVFDGLLVEPSCFGVAFLGVVDVSVGV